MKPRVYIETTIPSFYHETRAEPEIVVRKNWTREWWDEHSNDYELLTSVAVIEELERGTYPHQQLALELVAALPVLQSSQGVIAAVQEYIARKLMPGDPSGDALHLALASAHDCDFLLTWNCRHLANANKFTAIRQINTKIGLPVPNLVTPLELLAERAP